MFTILGGRGFIGSNLARALEGAGEECWIPERGDSRVFSRELGHVIYCIGLTADFRGRPFDTVRAHACHLAEVLERSRFGSLLYLSSTRVYMRSRSAREDTVLGVTPLDPGDLYNLSKLMGESLCLSYHRDTVRVARISNVVGEGADDRDFLPALLSEARQGQVTLGSSLESEKDYVGVGDVAAALAAIVMKGSYRLYNVASGANTSNHEVANIISSRSGARVLVAKDAATVAFPPIDIGRARSDLGFSPRPGAEAVQSLIDGQLRAP